MMIFACFVLNSVVLLDLLALYVHYKLFVGIGEKGYIFKLRYGEGYLGVGLLYGRKDCFEDDARGSFFI